jgi:hypothetical protein
MKQATRLAVNLKGMALLLADVEPGNIHVADIRTWEDARGIPADVVILLDPDPSPELVEKFKGNLSNSWIRKIYTLSDIMKLAREK